MVEVLEEEEAVDGKELVGLPTASAPNAVIRHYIEEEFLVFPRLVPTVGRTWLRLAKRLHMMHDMHV